MSSSNIRSAAFVPTTIDYAKAKAKHLRKLLAEIGTIVSLADAQRLTAKALGHPDWHSLATVIKARLPASPLIPALPPDKQASVWLMQMSALQELGIFVGGLSEVLKAWQLAGSASPPVHVSAEQIAQALAQAWPADDSVVSKEVQVSVACIVQNMLSELNKEGVLTVDVHSATLADILHLQCDDAQAPHGLASNQVISVSEALRKNLTSGNDAVDTLYYALKTALLGPDAMYTQSPAASTIKDLLTDRLYQVALEQAGNATLWELFFVPPSADGLTLYYNSRKPLSLPSMREGGDEDDENDEGDLPFPSKMTPYPPAVSEHPLSDALTLYVRQRPVFNEYADDFRITRLAATLRTAEGDNVGFIDGRLYESRLKRVDPEALLMLADSQDQGSLEVVEALYHHIPGFAACFTKGSLLHLEALELASTMRGRGYAAVLIEGLLAHVEGLAGRAGGLLLDISPSQLPWVPYEGLPAPILEETRRAASKLRAHALAMLERPALKGVPYRFLRVPYPDNIAERVK